MTNKADEKKIDEIYLPNFKKNNPHCSISLDKETLLIEKPWGLEDARLRVPIKSHATLKEIDKVLFDPRFDAIIHLDKNTIEFVFGYLQSKSPTSSEYMNREFVIFFEGDEYLCKYAPPTNRLLNIAKHYERIPSDDPLTSAPQLLAFKDAQNLDKLPPRIQEYFKDREPRSFIVKAKKNIKKLDVERLSRHINFICGYYDRKSPFIIIKNIGQKAEKKHLPIRYVEEKFPEKLLVHPIDDIILKLLDVARGSEPRFSFLYHYQVFEYAGYYYIDENAKKSIRNFLKDPTVIACGESRVSELFSIFSDLNHNDDVKMRKVIEDTCSPELIWKEIENDKEFFSNPVSFDGGFVSQALIAKDTTLTTWKTMWMPKTYDLLTKIRNALVHARERRENKVILPTHANNEKLLSYIPLISRIAELVALKG
jgi:hypothetical protein